MRRALGIVGVVVLTFIAALGVTAWAQVSGTIYASQPGSAVDPTGSSSTALSAPSYTATNTNGSNAFICSAAAATGAATTKNSSYSVWNGNYWNGSASTAHNWKAYNHVVTTGPTSEWCLDSPTVSEVFKITQAGAGTFASTITSGAAAGAAAFVSDGYKQAATTNNNYIIARYNGTGGAIIQTSAGSTLFQWDSSGKMYNAGASPSIASGFNVPLAIGGQATHTSGNIFYAAANAGTADPGVFSVSYLGQATMVGGAVIGTSGTAITKSLASTTTIDVASIAAATCLDTAITLTGAAVNAACSVGAPAAPDGNVNYTCYVSATNTVQLRGCNHQTVGAVDPASASYAVRVMNP